MAVNYNKLWKMMIDKKMSKTELTNLRESAQMQWLSLERMRMYE